jgi:predicted O-methyltransferase YrrM
MHRHAHELGTVTMSRLTAVLHRVIVAGWRLTPEGLRRLVRSTSWHRDRVERRLREEHREALASFAVPLEEHGITGQLSEDVATWAPFLRFAGPGHFYSPIPRLDDLEKDAHRIWPPPPREVPGVAIDGERMRATFDAIADAVGSEVLPTRPTPERRYYSDNVAFGIGDATVLQGMLRIHQPSRIVEIGSGYSSALILDEIEHLPACSAVFVEPHTELLRSLMRGEDADRCVVVPCRAQDLPIDVIEELGDGDLLFIDSTHVVRTGSDVCRIVFELLPAVAPGVMVHIHDVFWPFELPRAWVEEGRQWGETYLIRAFLTANDEWEIVMFNDWFQVHERDLIRRRLPQVLENPGGSLWLRRVTA